MARPVAQEGKRSLSGLDWGVAKVAGENLGSEDLRAIRLNYLFARQNYRKSALRGFMFPSNPGPKSGCEGALVILGIL